jgi:uncharacterized protein (DUF58 family)
MLPTRRLVCLLAYGAPLWIVAAVAPGGFLLGAVYILCLVTLCLWEAYRLPAAGVFQVTRELPHRFSLDAVQTITLRLHNGSALWLHLRVRDELPAALEYADTAVLLESTLAPQQTLQLAYQVRSLQRGLHAFGDVVLRLEHGFGLLQRQLRLPIHNEIKVYPHCVALHDYALLIRIDQRHEVIRQARHARGRGTDFESLRPYVAGEDLRTVDWKASARRGTLVSRNLQVEKGQQVAVLVDAGRLMTERIGKLTRFDHALNATVMLSYVAQKRGDSMAVATFSNRIESFLPPTQGQHLVPRVLESLYRVQPRALEADYWHVVATVLTRLKRRSLVIILTDVLDAAASSGLMTNLVRAVAKHLVLCVVLTEPRLAALADASPGDVAQTYTKAAAAQILWQRHLALEQMRAKGILVLETDPWHFSVQLVRRYLEIRQGALL